MKRLPGRRIKFQALLAADGMDVFKRKRGFGDAAAALAVLRVSFKPLENPAVLTVLMAVAAQRKRQKVLTQKLQLLNAAADGVHLFGNQCVNRFSLRFVGSIKVKELRDGFEADVKTAAVSDKAQALKVRLAVDAVVVV